MSNLQNLALPGLLSAVIGYLLGSVSFSILFTRFFSKTDIRTVGSGNAGATNVLRTAGKLPALLTFIFDFLKCAAAVVLARRIFLQFYVLDTIPDIIVAQYGAYIAGIACVLGHIFPVYFKFKGGKGVVTSIAMIMIIDWRVSLFVWGAFIIAVLFSKMVSLGSICGAIIYPFATFFFAYFVDYRSASSVVPLSYVWLASVAALILASIVVIKHRFNIQRIRAGTEKKISFKEKHKAS